MAIQVIAVAGRDRPADGLLREELARARALPREIGAEAARLVFAYYRWRGWLDRSQSWSQQFAEAREWAARFAQRPGAFPESDWIRAVPGWVLDHVSAETAWLRSLQEEPGLWLRARPGQREALAEELGGGDPAGEWAPDALRYHGGKDVFRTEAFHAGRVEIQDLASQVVSLLASPQAGESWWDACAGEGGKTLHLGDLMGNRGTVWATDRAEWRLQRLRRRAARAGLFNLRWGPWEPGVPPPGKGRFEGVLVDAPCSGVGTWQRNPHARWTLSPGDVRELADRQGALLEAARAGVAPGGRLVYAVCTLTREETLGVAERFEGGAPEFQPLTVPEGFRRGEAARSAPAHHLWILPQDWGANGMFVAMWRRAT